MTKSKGWRRDSPVPVGQLSFADAGGTEGWRPPRRPARRRKLPPVSPGVQGQVERFATILRMQGQLSESTIANYSRALIEAVRQAERLLGHRVSNLEEIFEPGLLAGVIKADTPVAVLQDTLDPTTPRNRRLALEKYLQVCGLTGLSFEGATQRFHDVLRSASRRVGSRFILGVGRKRPPRPRPKLDDFDAVLAAATTGTMAALAARNRALLLLARHTGLRRHSLTGMRGEHFSRRPEGLFVSVRLKGRPQRQEREVPEEAARAIEAYVEVFNARAASKGWPARIGIGVSGAFWRTYAGKPLVSGDVLSNEVRRWAWRAGVRFTLHDARHLFGGMLSDRLGPDRAAQAGDWSAGVFRKYYSRPAGRWRPVDPVSSPPDRHDGHEHPGGWHPGRPEEAGVIGDVT